MIVRFLMSYPSTPSPHRQHRKPHQILLPNIRSQAYLKSYLVLAAIAWNALPISLQTIKSPGSFRRALSRNTGMILNIPLILTPFLLSPKTFRQQLHLGTITTYPLPKSLHSFRIIYTSFVYIHYHHNVPKKQSLFQEIPSIRFKYLLGNPKIIIIIWKKVLLENTHACQFWPIFRYKTFERNKISKFANNILERRQLRGSVPNFKTKALAIRKLKGNEIVEMNIEKRPVLCTTLYRKPMQPSNFDGILYQLRH